VLHVADRAAVMLHGRVVRTGSPTAIADDLESAYLAGAIEPSPT
jgi:branched-chain amino acid transport system ATP-binding protein